MNNNTDITYEKTRSNANTIQECARTMENIFDSFGQSMQRVTNEGLYAGDASEALMTKFNTLKSRFGEYVTLVNDFANMILGATQDTQTTEATLRQNAEEFKG